MFAQNELPSYAVEVLVNDNHAIELTDIPTSRKYYYFRLHLSGQTVDIFSDDKVVFYGEIINSIQEYGEVKVNDQIRTEATLFYTQKVQIDSSLATSLTHQFIDSKQYAISTDTINSSWRLFFRHCQGIVFEIKDEHDYVKQSFACPWSQPDSAAFKDLILSNFNRFRQELKLDSIYSAFESNLPGGKTYSRDGYLMTYLFTDQQNEELKKNKPRRDYLKSIRDTVDSYLRMKLEEQNLVLEEIDCLETYTLFFKENGKLKSVTVSEESKPKILDGLSWYFEDKREIRKCKRLIRKIYREIDLSSFNLKYKVARTLSFGIDGEARLYDNMIY